MGPFDCRIAADVDEAVALLADHAPHARVIAGGTDLLVELKEGKDEPALLVDITRIPELRGIELTSDGLRVGALATHSEIVRSALVKSRCPVLAQAARSIGAVQTRNLGTVAGNLVSAVPSMDMGPALIALDAVLTLADENGRRTLPLERFWLAPRRTLLSGSEIVVSVLVPHASLDRPTAFLKFGLRKGQALALVNVAAGFNLGAPEPVCRNVRIALGAVAPTVIRAAGAEACLEGRTLRSGTFDEAAQIAAAEARPIDDFRASAEYRRNLIRVLTRRALEAAHESASTVSREVAACVQ